MTCLDLAAIRAELAAIEHERWAHWQKYLHDLCTRGINGSLVIPAALVERWERQIATSYADLSEREQLADLAEVDRYWPIIQRLLDAQAERLARRELVDTYQLAGDFRWTMEKRARALRWAWRNRVDLCAARATAQNCIDRLAVVLSERSQARADAAEQRRRAEHREKRWRELAEMILEIYHINSGRPQFHDKPAPECTELLCVNYRKEIAELAALAPSDPAS